MKNNLGITLVSLVVTIIILLILAGVGITVLIQTGLFENANQAKSVTENAQKDENNILEDFNKNISKVIGTSREEYSNLENSKLKLLTTVSENTQRKIGKYNMSTFIKDENENIKEFLEYDSSNNCYIVKKSAWYILDVNIASAQNADYPTISLNIFINNDKFSSVIVKPFNVSSDANSKSITLFLSTANTIRFEKEIETFNNNNWNQCYASIFVMTK